ncbi:MAG: hypothetical protein COV46_01890 [Deltaproteobacteria bacterium CG11_big_fil_rev_8_21_14_0_20_49_13]|nr:MAG: hypothetical protein COV46_01890 [Deltaproteobacteria bacterium CG11_big_fil_rev_8_21_14_0_20_49_13]
MTRRDEELEMQELVVEHTQDPGLDGVNTKNPTVLSCGGIFIPRPRPMGRNDELYKILNTTNKEEPTKLVTGSLTFNILQEVLHKESMN